MFTIYYWNLNMDQNVTWIERIRTKQTEKQQVYRTDLLASIDASSESLIRLDMFSVGLVRDSSIHDGVSP